MFNCLKKTPITDFQMRNEDAYREYCRKENTKFLIKGISTFLVGTVVVVLTLRYLEKLEASIPAAD